LDNNILKIFIWRFFFWLKCLQFWKKMNSHDYRDTFIDQIHDAMCPPILVNWGSHHKISHRLGAWTVEMYFLTVLETRSLRQVVKIVRFRWKLSSWLLGRTPSHYVLTWLLFFSACKKRKRERESSLVSLLIRALIP
jgi:hypothetical protein